MNETSLGQHCVFRSRSRTRRGAAPRFQPCLNASLLVRDARFSILIGGSNITFFAIQYSPAKT